jgi:hypothetical protein
MALEIVEKTLQDVINFIPCLYTYQSDPHIYHLRIDDTDIKLPERATVEDLMTSLRQNLGVEEYPVSSFDINETHFGIRILVNGELAWSGEHLSDMRWHALVIEIGNREFVAKQRCFLPYRRVDFTLMGMPIEIKSVFGSAVVSTLQVNDMTIKELKQRIYEDSHIIPEAQSLVYKGQQLKDHFTISSYNVKAYDVIYMVRRLRGGGRNKSSCTEWNCGCTKHIPFIGCCAVCRRVCKCTACQVAINPDIQNEAAKVKEYYRKIDTAASECSKEDKEDALFR